jgi:heat shock protein HslJ
VRGIREYGKRLANVNLGALMRRRSILITLMIVGVLAVAAVVAVLVVSAQRKPSSGLTQSTWTLTMLVADGQTLVLSPSQPATIHFDPHAGQASGTGGCNTFSGPFSSKDNQVQFGQLLSTLMECDDSVVFDNAVWPTLLIGNGPPCRRTIRVSC